MLYSVHAVHPPKPVKRVANSTFNPCQQIAVYCATSWWPIRLLLQGVFWWAHATNLYVRRTTLIYMSDAYAQVTQCLPLNKCQAPPHASVPSCHQTSPSLFSCCTSPNLFTSYRLLEVGDNLTHGIACLAKCGINWKTACNRRLLRRRWWSHANLPNSRCTFSHWIFIFARDDKALQQAS